MKLSEELLMRNSGFISKTIYSFRGFEQRDPLIAARRDFFVYAG